MISIERTFSFCTRKGELVGVECQQNSTKSTPSVSLWLPTFKASEERVPLSRTDLIALRDAIDLALDFHATAAKGGVR